MIKAHPPVQVRSKIALAKKIVKHHFGKNPAKIEFKPEGKTNFVFEAVMTKKEKYIIRIGTAKEKLSDFRKEQWVVERVSEKNVPVAKILEIGSDVIPFPYMIQEKLDGEEAIHHRGRLEILFEMGAYTRLIHSITTNGFGNVFDWSNNRRLKNETWKDFLYDEWGLHGRFSLLKKHRLVDSKRISKLSRAMERVVSWKHTGVLNHGDIRLKNVIVNDKGKILAFIDWEHSVSAHPFWDLSIALHDLSIDAKERFLEGYGMDLAEYEKFSYGIKFFNILNYTQALENIIKNKDKNLLALYRLRLNGYLDLFSL